MSPSQVSDTGWHVSFHSLGQELFINLLNSLRTCCQCLSVTEVEIILLSIALSVCIPEEEFHLNIPIAKWLRQHRRHEIRLKTIGNCSLTHKICNILRFFFYIDFYRCDFMANNSKI